MGLVNTGVRLRRMYGEGSAPDGSLKIAPQDGGGTIVTMWTPDRLASEG